MSDKEYQIVKGLKHIEKLVFGNPELFKGRRVLDVPAGVGFTSKLLKYIGANVEAYDLFPEFFNVEGIICNRIDLQNKFDIPDAYADHIFCQEGLEHLSDQLFALKEFNRVLKLGGKLFVTVPNYSNLKSKISYLINESEYALKMMPPNEIDSIWISEQDEKKTYYGHIFLIGIQRLRVLAKLAGFKVSTIRTVRTNKTSMWLLLVIYPVVFVLNWITYYKQYKKSRVVDWNCNREVYKEILKLNLDWKVLTDNNLFVEFEKSKELEEATTSLSSSKGSISSLAEHIISQAAI